MQLKFTQKNLQSFLKIFALALILVSSFQLTYAQQSRVEARPQSVIDAKLLAMKAAKLQSSQFLHSKQQIAVNDAGRVSTPLDAPAHRTEAICTTFVGAFAGTEPSFTTGRLFRDGIASTCAAPKVCPGNTAAGTSFRYVTYTFTEASGSPQCVTITHNNVGAAGAPHLSIHNGPFSTANICTNYLADEGGSPNPTFNVVTTFTIPANTTVTLLLTETAAGAGGAWNITVEMPVCAVLPPCSGTPAPGNTVSTNNPVCPNVNFTLSVANNPAVTGLNHQWQRSTVAIGGPYTNIVGATSSTFTTSQTVATFYRDSVTCVNGLGNAKSNPLQVTMNLPSACYCTPVYTDGCTFGDYIANVTLGTLNNTTLCSTPPFTYYSAIPAPSVFIGATQNLTVTVGPDVFGQFVGAWIDYNQDGAFTASEFLGVSANAGPGGTVSLPFTVPLGTPTGTTRMRVRGGDDVAMTSAMACGATNSTFGEAEDYNVSIIPCVPVVITTPPANASVACGSSTSFTVAVTGSAPAFSWQYRVNAASPWLTVPNAPPYSGVTTSTLTLTNVPSTMTGYQYRALVVGVCSALDFSSPPATLTVTPLIATVTPTSATICAGSIVQLTLTNIASPVTTLLINEGFNTVAPLPTGWAAQNNSVPVGLTGWFQGNTTVFAAQSGPPDSYIGANFNNTTGANVISNWLMTPNVSIKNGDILTFYTRTVDAPAFPDRLEVRMSTNGASTNVGATNASVGDFTTLLLTVNQGLTTAGYPNAWTQFTATITGVTGTVSGRFAFRYFVPDGGPAGNNSDFIGIDNVVYSSTVGGVAQGIWSQSPASPNSMFTDAAAGNAYTGTPATSIYVKPAVSTNYSVVYTTPTPCTSSPTVIPVTVINPITAVVSPVNTAVCVNGNATFTVSAGGGPFTYQWQVSTNGGASYTDITGATSATYTATAVTQLMSGNRYRAVLTAAPCGTSTSGAAILTVNALPVVTISSTDLTLTPGQTTTLTASSVPAAGSATSYSWTMNGSPLSPAVTGNSVVVGVDALGTYQARVTDVNGCSNTSNSLTVGAEFSEKLWIYPNPTTGLFQVRLFYDGAVADRRVLSVIDVLGHVVIQREFDLVTNTAPYLQMNLDATRLPAGTYVVQVKHKVTGKIKSGLLVKFIK